MLNVVEKLELLLTDNPNDEIIGAFHEYTRYNQLTNFSYLAIERAFKLSKFYKGYHV